MSTTRTAGHFHGEIYSDESGPRFQMWRFERWGGVNERLQEACNGARIN